MGHKEVKNMVYLLLVVKLLFKVQWCHLLDSRQQGHAHWMGNRGSSDLDFRSALLHLLGISPSGYMENRAGRQLCLPMAVLLVGPSHTQAFSPGEVAFQDQSFTCSHKKAEPVQARGEHRAPNSHFGVWPRALSPSELASPSAKWG